MVKFKLLVSIKYNNIYFSGLNQLMWYYAELEKDKCYHLPNGLPDFDGQERACTIWRRYAK